VFDFGARPPELNSALIYDGPGSGSLLAAASAWDAVAAELSTAAQGYGSVVTELTGSPWVGPSSRTMLAAVTPYVTWMNAVAIQAEETASQARAAAAAYETAFMMTIPPPVIAANRVQLMTLVATNFFGQNFPAIAATEAEYLFFWAEDAAAMYGYAGSSATATELSQFDPAPSTTTPDAEPKQAAAVAQAVASPAGNSAQNSATQLISSGAVPQALQQAAAAPPLANSDNFIWNTIQDFLMYGLPTPTNNYTGITPASYTAIIKQTLTAYFATGLANFGWSIGQQLFNGPAGGTAGSAGAFFANPAFSGLSAGGYAFHPLAPAVAHTASATRIGGLSVPQAWLNAPGMPGAAEAPGVKLVSAHLANAVPGGVEGNPGTNGLVRGIPPMGARSAQRAGNLGVRYGFRYSVLCRPPSAG
jgi:PPE-repeat protein